MSITLAADISPETWDLLNKTSIVLAILTPVVAAIKWRPISQFWQEYTSTALSFDGRVDYMKVENGRYLLRLLGAVTNKKEHSVTVTKLTIDENTIPWSIPEEFHMIAKRGDNSENITIVANEFKPVWAGSLVPLAGQSSFPIYNFGHFETWSSTDRKPRKSIRIKLHTSSRTYKFHVIDVREVTIFSPTPAGFHPIYTFSFGSIHD
jgi:hypothetical protein